MSNLASRVLVVVVGLPLVLGLVWLGGWWLFVLAAAVGLLALHEFYAMTRPLRPLVLAGYVGLVLTLVAAQVGGFDWVAGGLFATVALAFLLKGLADTRQSATAAIGATVLGVAWIGLGLVALLALARPARARPARGLRRAARRLGGRHVRVLRRPPGRPAQARADDLARQDVGGLRRRHGGDRLRHVRRALPGSRRVPLDRPGRSCSALALAAAAPLGDLFESLLKRDMGVKDSGRLLARPRRRARPDRRAALRVRRAFYLILAFDKV